MKNPTVRDALKSATRSLEAARIEDPASEAEFLLTHLLRIKRHELFTGPERVLTDAEAVALASFLARRAAGEPAQYITGETEFRGLAFRVTPDVLIPRPETELLVDTGLKAAALKATSGAHGNAPPVAVDLCTGSGCIAVSLARELPGWRVYATDISKAALAIARSNARSNGVAERVEFLEGDLFAPLAGVRAHLVLSNPPYVTAAQMEALQPEVAHWEPRGALYGGPDGLDFYRRIVREAPAHLFAGGSLLMELGFGEALAVRGLLEADGRYAEIEITKDFAGIERVVRAVAASTE
ncbi:MAG: peptide chain release factor N(5)-glutamine methyltransferase [Thermodesulfobacteriota bacterium]